MIKYISDSVEWIDKTYGNTYSSTHITSTETREVVKVFPFALGSGSNNRLIFMRDNGLDFSEVRENTRSGTRKQAEQWGKL